MTHKATGRTSDGADRGHLGRRPTDRGHPGRRWGRGLPGRKLRCASAPAKVRENRAALRPSRPAPWAGGVLIGVVALWFVQPVLGEGFDRAIDAASARVVKLYGLGAGAREGYGTGIVVSEDGLVLTVLSLLLDGRNVRVVAPDGSLYHADVIGRDEKEQLALVRLKPEPEFGPDGQPLPPDRSKLPTFACFAEGESTSLVPGDWVIAAGNPFKVADGAEPVSVALGVFSTRAALDARFGVNDFPFTGEVLVIDAVTSNPGAPGSALVDLDGRWVGMIGRVVVSNATRTQLNYAMPVETCLAFIERTLNPHTALALAEESAGEPYSGIKLFKQGYKRGLAYVDKVARGSPADKAGVRSDDLILSANGKQISDLTDFERVIANSRAGQTIELVIERNRKVITTSLTLEEQR